MTDHDTTLASADDWPSSLCVPSTGTGTLAALGNVVLLVGSTDPAAVGPLLGQAQRVAADGGQGRALVRRFAVLMAAADPDVPVPAFVALAPHSTGLAVLVQGEATITVNGETIDGAQSLAWVERLVSWPVADIVASVDRSATVGGGLFRLSEGVVSAGGFTITTGISGELVDLVEDHAPAERPGTGTGPISLLAAQMDREAPEAPAPAPPPPAPPVQAPPAQAPPAPTPPAPTPPAPTPPAPAPAPAVAPAPPERPLPPPPADIASGFDSVLIDDVEVDPPTPLPIVQEAPLRPEHAGASETVRGVYCKNRHFNDPRQLFCAICGINMVQQTPVLVNGPRPPLGTLVLDDGSVFQLGGDYLIGRDPDSDERVIGGDARGVAVQDTSNQISRVHARLELRNWDVVLVDNASTNGTFINPPQTAGWQRLPSGGEYVLVQGTRVRIGHRTLAFNTHGGAAR